MRYTTIPYSPAEFNFVSLLERLFYSEKVLSAFHLEDLHLVAKKDYPELFKIGQDSSTEFHAKVYDRLREGWPKFEKLYLELIGWVVAPLFDDDFLFQKQPTIRFHIPGNVAVGDFHTDAEFNHPSGEINFIIPLTNSDGTACPYVESEPGQQDFEPIPLRVGQLIRFNGNELRHGNKINETSATRVSMDFRILPISKYNPEGTGESITKKTRFVEGEYYNRYTK